MYEHLCRPEVYKDLMVRAKERVSHFDRKAKELEEAYIWSLLHYNHNLQKGSFLNIKTDIRGFSVILVEAALVGKELILKGCVHGTQNKVTFSIEDITGKIR